MKTFALLLVLALMLSCEKELLEADALGENSGIVGTWVDNGVDDDITLLKRAENFDLSKYGFTINDDGTFVERKNANWEYSAPIAYDEFDGTWEAVSDSLLTITVGYWGGTMTYQIRIVSLDQENLGIRYLYAEDRAQSNKSPN